MREIKFRVWDNVDYMSEPFTLNDLQTKKIEFTSECKVMQYTGLKDCNGKEAYEGDKNDRGEWIVYSDFLGAFGWTDGGYFRPLTNNLEADFEIIGNIFQSPEL